MAKKMVYICDGEKCGTVLVNPDDGFVISGSITNTLAAGDAKVLLAPPPRAAGAGSDPGLPTAEPLSLCRECMATALGLHP